MMKSVPKLVIFLLAIFLAACNNKATSKVSAVQVEENMASEPTSERLPKAEQLLMETLKAHGGDLYDTASYTFEFRGKQYSFSHNNAGYLYSVSHEDHDKIVLDVLKNGTFSRKIDGKLTEMTKKDISKYTEALNGVIYFATLPYKLKDKAVNKSYKGRTIIKGRTYDILEITFDQEGGGKDHNDEFMYWINSETKHIDYLAYRYFTSGGGVRFRSGYNPRTVAGIRFQDYINLEAPVRTPLDSLPKLFEEGKLKALSKIETENVVCLEARCS
ncbi:MAG: hypothetical protein E4H26_03120 [Flavobacteriales bacterium]|nr:MAG: hypothetical protein E4H26_03120 [Flavobacteriales bacterium]